MSFFKEIRSHLATFETKSKADVENFIAHLEEVFKEHNITAISHAHKSSAPPTAVDSAIPTAPVGTISPIQQQVIAAAQSAPTPEPEPVTAPAPVVVAPVITAEPVVIKSTSIAPVASPTASTVSE